ncbi:MAG: PAS domain-containing protein [Sneathiella sp.]
MVPIDGIDQSHPIVKEGYAYWLSKCHGNSLPRWSDFDPAEIKSLLPNIVVTHVMDNPRDYVEKITGERVIERSSMNSAGKNWSAIPGRGPGSKIWTVFSDIVENKQPILNRIPYVGPHLDFIDIDTVCCPISENGETVDRIVAFIGYIRSDSNFGTSKLTQKFKNITARLRS